MSDLKKKKKKKSEQHSTESSQSVKVPACCDSWLARGVVFESIGRAGVEFVVGQIDDLMGSSSSSAAAAARPTLGAGWVVVQCACAWKVLVLGVLAIAATSSSSVAAGNFSSHDKELLQVALNLEYLEAEYFLWAAYGSGLDKLAPNLTGGGPQPLGVQKANLGPYYTDLYEQMGLQEVGHLRYHPLMHIFILELIR